MRIRYDILNWFRNDELFNAIARSMDSDAKRMQEGQMPDLSTVHNVPPFNEDDVLECVFTTISERQAIHRRHAYRIAAVVLLLVVAGVWTYMMRGQQPVAYDEIYACKGEQLVVVLPDGSRVRLNADSKLLYPRQFTGSERRVRLVGEGFFEVSKDKEHPFYVDCYDMEIKVTGTQFNVNAYPENSQMVTTLYEGSVSVGDKNTPEKYRRSLLPGQEAVYTCSSHSLNVRKSVSQSQDELWTHQVISVQDMGLEQLLRTLERQYGVTFHVKNQRIRGYTYNLTCGAANLQDVFDVMQTITPIHITKVADHEYDVY